eukprot:sb/3478483/
MNGSEAKKPKLDSPVGDDISTYSITELLGQSDDGRVVFTLGEIRGKEGPAVVLFEVGFGPTETSRQPIIARYLGHVTGYQPIRVFPDVGIGTQLSLESLL